MRKGRDLAPKDKNGSSDPVSFYFYFVLSTLCFTLHTDIVVPRSYTGRCQTGYIGTVPYPKPGMGPDD
jgi:hypothetical protein